MAPRDLDLLLHAARHLPGLLVTLAPESLSQADFTALRELGFDDLGILDVINYTAFFANANRLMLTLGEPYPAR